MEVEKEMEKGKNMEVLKKKMTRRSYRQWLIQQTQKRLKSSENVVEKEDEVAEEEDDQVIDNNHHHEDAQRVDDEREKQTCSSKKDDDKIEGQSKNCSVCKQEGNLLRCAGRGCKRNFHLSCLDPPVTYFPPGPWHCYWCAIRKMKLGVHAVSDGVESLLDVRECSLGNKGEKKWEYLVKYRGLAHVHNRWITDDQLRLEGQAALTRFKKNHKSKSWKTEWSHPHRLLDKRMLAVTDHNTNADCHYEWFVKWTDLDYSHATWELANASFLRPPEAAKLMADYEIRHQQAKKELLFLTEDEKMKAEFQELRMPVYINHLSYISTLHKYWQKGQSAVIIDDQEGILKVVLFQLSLPKDVGLPFLIITTSAALPLWEAEFSCWVDANIVVYKGNRDVRAIIRTLEFYNKQGALMFQVLLSSYDAIVEDLEMLKPIRWGAVIIDQCQGSAFSTHHSQIKMLIADMRLLIFCQDFKCVTRFNRCNVLSLLDPKYDKANNELLDTDSDIDLTEFKESFKHFVAYECKSSASKFIEYWVPVKLSNEQIEQYSACLLSNSTWLCSSLKNDSPNCISDILESTRKCCDHPYLKDESLRGIVTKDIPQDQHLDAEIKLSGKLELLNTILREIKQRGQRVLVLFRSHGGSGVNSLRNILDDFINQKFGGDSYTSIGRNVTREVKEAILNKFNNNGSGKFAFLMETSACVRSVKLSRIDTVILFNSDWDPNNDLRSLLKITVNSMSENIKVLRLYSCFTIEEKALILAKQGLPIESNIQSIKQAACQELLSWGASYLFNVQSSISKRSSEVDDLDDVFPELSRLMSTNCENSDYNHCSKILKVQNNGGTYSSEMSLLGEVEMQRTDDSSFVRGLLENEPPHVFWKNLLHEMAPRWKRVPSSSRGSRRKVRLGEQVCEKEGNRVYLTLEPKLRKKRTPRPSAGNKHKSRRIGAVNDASMRSRNTQEDQCLPDASPNTPSLPQSPNPNPLQMEMERIQKEKEQTTKLLEDVKLLLKSQMEEELDSVRKKYDLLFQIAEKESAQQKKELDTMYSKVHMHKLLAEAMTTQVPDTADTVGSLEMTEDDVGRTITGTGQSSPNRPSSSPVVTASISEHVNSEQRAADPQISSENFPMAVIPSLNAEFPRVEVSAVVPRTSARATLQTASFSNLPTSGSYANSTPNYQSVILTPPNAELSRVKESAVVPRTSARATLKTASSSNLPTSGSHATPTPNYQSVILTPSQPSVQTLSNASGPGAGCEQRRPAPHLKPFRPPPTMNAWNPSLL